MVLAKLIPWSCLKLAILSCSIFCGNSHLTLQAEESPKFALHFASAEEPPKGTTGQMILAAVSEKSLPVRIAFWMGTACYLEDANGRKLKWTGAGSDSLRVPPPPEAIPSLSESGRGTLLMNVHLLPSRKEKKTAPTLLVTTEWGGMVALFNAKRGRLSTSNG